MQAGFFFPSYILIPVELIIYYDQVFFLFEHWADKVVCTIRDFLFFFPIFKFIYLQYASNHCRFAWDSVFTCIHNATALPSVDPVDFVHFMRFLEEQL